MPQRKRILFVCTANSARSLMAEALLRHMADDRFDVASAGTHAGQPHPLALACLAKAGIDTTGLHSKSLTDLPPQPWDYVITLCDRAARECPPVGPSAQQLNWNFPDPAVANRPAAFAVVLKELRERLSLFTTIHQSEVRAPIPYEPTAVFKMMGDPMRLATLLLIREQEELCVCELCHALNASQPRISRQLALLREQALLDGERRGQWVYYRLHTGLPEWILTTLAAASCASDPLLQAARDQLATMAERPSKTDCV